MKTFTLIICAAIALIFTSCSKSPQSAIIGRWHQVGTQGIVAFYEDGTMEVSEGQKDVMGKYSFISDSKLKIEVSGKSQVTTVYEIAFADNQMSWTGTDINGEKTQYQKAK